MLGDGHQIGSCLRNDLLLLLLLLGSEFLRLTLNLLLLLGGGKSLLLSSLGDLGSFTLLLFESNFRLLRLGSGLLARC